MSLAERAFGPANARVLGAMRVAIGVAALMELASSGPRILALAEPGALRLPILEPVASIFSGFAPLVLGAWLLAGIGFVLGRWTTVSGVILAAVLGGLVTADEQLYNNHSYLLAVVVAILTAARAGDALSLDARRSGTDGLPAPAWTVLALRAQLSIVYLFAAISKLNPSFLSGSVISAALRRDGIAFPEAWITFEPMFVLSVLVILVELLLAIGLWFRRWRGLALVAGLVLHVGIVLTMHAAWDLAGFSVATLALYLAFVDAPRGGHVVVWDDGCGFCGAWVRWFRRLDWLDTLRFVPRSALAESTAQVRAAVSAQAAAEALHLVRQRHVSRGFAAVTDVLAVLPVSFLWAPILRAPAIASAGERAYRRVARRRTCPVPLLGAGLDPAPPPARAAR